MTSDLPGQGKSSFKHLHNSLYTFPSLLAGKDGKNTPVAGETRGRGDDVLQMGTWHSDASQTAPRRGGFFSAGSV